MFLKARPLQLEAKKPIAILNKEDAEDIGVKPLDRIELKVKNKTDVAIVNVAEHVILKGEIGLFESIQRQLDINMGERVRVTPAPRPASINAIKKKLAGKPLKKSEMRGIVKDVVQEKLSDIEVTAFVIALHNYGMTMNEVASLSSSMAETGSSLRIKEKVIYDKHSIGGVPGDKTSMLLVPTIAAAGLTIPKTSSRAITAPAGTADRVECICPVDLDMDEIKEVVNKTNGCMVWGGAVDLAPADDAFIQIEYPLSIDPLLLPSVMSKKKAVNANYVVIDIPTGRGVKIKTIGEAEELGNRFIELGKRLGINVNCVSTFADQPIGHGIGPALEARELLEVVAARGRGGPKDLINKVLDLSSVLLEFSGIKNGREKAWNLIRSGKTEKKLRQIIEAQGGDPKIKPDDLDIGDYSIKIRSNLSGTVLWINNSSIAQIAREAGAPKHKGAGIYLHKKLGSKVKRGETIFEIFAEQNYKLNRAIHLSKESNVIGIGKEYEMVLAEIPEEDEEKKYFIIDR